MALHWASKTEPSLVLMKGPPGRGKSTIARELGRHLCWPVIDKDVFRDLIDPPGCGRSSSIGASGVIGLVEAIDRVRVVLGVDEWTLGGHSFGADLGLAYALARPRHTRSVLAISPTGFPRGELVVIEGAGHHRSDGLIGT